ncbi:MAG: electron transport complex subunit E [Lachnospiraceae bacterium]|nr:electron transport complex subunit E [Lachnospiraceae bacterium]
MNSGKERLINGIVKENPTFVLMLGMCPTLAVTTSAMNGLGMGLTTTVVLALSNVFIAILRNIIPDKVRIPAFIVIIASFVTMLELLLEGFMPSLYDALGIYIPLIVVNCIILGRAEAYASKNPAIPSFFDGLGMGLGFSFALTCIGAVRELLGAGDVFGFHLMPTADHPWMIGGNEVAFFTPASIFVLAPGAFFVLACLVAIQNKIKMDGEKKGKDMSKIGSGCSDDCLNCGETGCSGRKFYDPEGSDGPVGKASGNSEDKKKISEDKQDGKSESQNENTEAKQGEIEETKETKKEEGKDE